MLDNNTLHSTDNEDFFTAPETEYYSYTDTPSSHDSNLSPDSQFLQQNSKAPPSPKKLADATKLDSKPKVTDYSDEKLKERGFIEVEIKIFRMLIQRESEKKITEGGAKLLEVMRLAMQRPLTSTEIDIFRFFINKIQENTKKYQLNSKINSGLWSPLKTQKSSNSLYSSEEELTPNNKSKNISPNQVTLEHDPSFMPESDEKDTSQTLSR